MEVWSGLRGGGDWWLLDCRGDPDSRPLGRMGTATARGRVAERNVRPTVCRLKPAPQQRTGRAPPLRDQVDAGDDGAGAVDGVAVKDGDVVRQVELRVAVEGAGDAVLPEELFAGEGEGGGGGGVGDEDVVDALVRAAGGALAGDAVVVEAAPAHAERAGEGHHHLDLVGVGLGVEVAAEEGDRGGHRGLALADPVERLLELLHADVLLEAPVGEVDVGDADAPDAGDEELAHDADAVEAEEQAARLCLEVALAVPREGVAADDRDAFAVARAFRAAGVVAELLREDVGGALLAARAAENNFLADDEIRRRPRVG